MLKNLKTCLTVTVFVVLLYFYNESSNTFYHKKFDKYDLIEEYILGDNPLSHNKPILWILNNHPMNSRQWEDFHSRKSNKLNKPFLHLCVQTIIKKCQDSFNICFIDDNSFRRLIPDWNITMSKLSNPIKQHLRILGIAKLLYYYGGMIMPISTICIKDLKPLFDYGISENGIFSIEGINRTNTSENARYTPNIYTFGCTKKHYIVQELVDYLQYLTNTDYTNELDFCGKINRFLCKKIFNKEIKLIKGNVIGIKTIENKEVFLKSLLGSSFIEFDENNLYTITFDSEKLDKRTNLNWFNYLSKDKVLAADTVLSKHLLLNLN